jgi:hypothetical protein
LLGPAILGVLLWRMKDRAAVLDTLRTAELGGVALALLLNAVVIHLKIVRWRTMLHARGIRYGWGRSYAAFLSALYLGLVTPGHVGDALRIQYLRHDANVPYAEGLATVVMDRLCDLYVLATVAAYGIARYGPALAGELAVVAWVAVVGALLAPLVLLVPGLADRFVGAVYRRLGRAEGTPDGYRRFVVGLRAQVGRPLLWTLPLTVLAFGVNYVQGWLLAGALGLPLALVDVACLLAIANLVALVPISVSGLGVREAMFMAIFPLLGLTAAGGVSFGLAVFGTVYLFNIVVGIAAWQVAPPPTGAQGSARNGE